MNESLIAVIKKILGSYFLARINTNATFHLDQKIPKVEHKQSCMKHFITLRRCLIFISQERHRHQIKGVYWILVEAFGYFIFTGL